MPGMSYGPIRPDAGPLPRPAGPRTRPAGAAVVAPKAPPAAPPPPPPVPGPQAALSRAAPPQTQPSPAVPQNQQVGVAIANHPLVAHREGRYLDREIGRLAAADPRAKAAADLLLGAVLDFHEFAKQHLEGVPQSRGDLFFGSAVKRTRRKSEAELEGLLKDGNLREKLLLVDGAAGALGPLLLQVGERVARDPAFARLAEQQGLRTHVLRQKYQAHLQSAAEPQRRRRYTGIVLDQASVLQDLPKIRTTTSVARFVPDSEGNRQRQLTDPYAAKNPEERAKVAFARQSGRTLRNWDTHSALPLSAVEKADLTRNLDADTAYPAGALAMTEGRYGKHPTPGHPWVQAAERAGVPTSAGISGTTYILMSFFQDLGGRAGQADAMRLACIGYLVPQHHAFVEVMAAAQEVGASSYRPSLKTSRSFLTELRSQAAPTQELARAADRVRIALDEEKASKP